MKKVAMILLLGLGLVVVTAAPVFADESVPILDDTDEGALFGGDEGGNNLVTEVPETNTTPGIENILLTSGELRWNGQFYFTFDSAWQWQNDVLDFSWLADHLTEPAMNFSPELGFRLIFDARPDKDFRVLGKADVTYPLDASAAQLADVFHIRELFADYNWEDRLFFRIGKHTIKWGVGYFYSPADILNITPIDPADPEKEREGPLSVKINYPFGLNNLYLYVIANDITDPTGIAFAPKMEWVIGNTEIGIGGFYRNDMAVRPRAMLTATFNLFDVDFYSEAVMSYGTERNFIRDAAGAPFGLEVVQDTETPFFDATLGFLYSYVSEEQNLNLSLLGQYFYNGDGYADPAFLTDNATGIAWLQTANLVSGTDLEQTAQHYWVLSGSLREILGSDFSASCTWIGASDSSGSIIPAVSWVSGTKVNLTVNAPMAYGKSLFDYFNISPGITLILYEKTKISLAAPLLFSIDSDNIPVWKTAGITLGLKLENALF